MNTNVMFVNNFSLLLVLFIARCQSGFNSTAGSNLNVVFIIFDDLRPILQGYEDNFAKTPNIDHFMRKSFYFTRAYSQIALCAPSRNSLLTSRRPDAIKLYDFYSYWRIFAGNFTTLPQYFRTNGYITHSAGKVFHPGLSSNKTDDYPDSWTYEPFHPATEKYLNVALCPNGNAELKRNLICPVRVKRLPRKTLPDIETIEEARRFLGKLNLANKKFFLAIGFHKPHIPFMVPKKFFEMYDNKSIFDYHDADQVKPFNMPLVSWNPYTDLRSRDDVLEQNVSFPYGPIPPNFGINIRQAYYASVSFVDHLLGKVLEKIDFSRTIIVITSDHGWSLGEHAEWAKYSNYENAVRVPLILYSPRFKLTKGQPIETVVELLDLFPTVVDLAELPALPICKNSSEEISCTEGKSLLPLILNRNVNRNCAYSQYPRPGAIPTSHPNSDQPKLKQIKIMGYSLRTDTFRYTLWIEFNPKTFTRNWRNIYGEELYDHRIDPKENLNLSENAELTNIRLALRAILTRKFLQKEDKR